MVTVDRIEDGHLVGLNILNCDLRPLVVRVTDVKDDDLDILLGVPQRSILDPLLLLCPVCCCKVFIIGSVC